MKKRIMLIALILTFSAQLLRAQGSAPISRLICPLEDECSPDPTPTPPPPPPPTPTPTPTPGLIIGPKFVVLSVTYAPPGMDSFATYSSSTLFGSSVAFNRSVGRNVSVNTTLGSLSGIGGIGGIFGGTSQTFTLEQIADTSVSIAVMDQSDESVTIRGPSSSSVGIDHNQDIIWLWLNPALDLRVPSLTTMFWDSFSFDPRDPANGVDLIGIPVGYLNGHVSIPTNVADVLARRWAPPILCAASDPECGPDGTKGPGLTATDFAQILKADPFTDPAYLIDVIPVPPAGLICTTDRRFCHIPNVNHTFQYLPPSSSGQPTTQTFTETRTANLSQQADISSSFTVGFSKQFSFNSTTDPNGIVLGNFLSSLSVQDTLTLTDKLSLANNLQLSQTSSFSITGPTAADNYIGPVELNVFQDNVYGTFAFAAVPQPTFDVAISPSTQNVAQGSCANYSVSILAKVSGFNSTVTLSISGLTPGIVANFSPVSITGAGVSTLQLCAPSANLGLTTFAVKGVSGIEAHSVNASVNVTPAPDYFLTATPVSQSVQPGSPASYTITVNRQNGFTGTVSLSASGLPPGAQASFSPASVTGGSSTLTITTAGTPLGIYPNIVVTGISGSLSRSVTISLTVSTTTGDFTLNVLPNSQTVTAGDSAFYSIVASPRNGFTGNISLDASGPGGDIFVDFGPSTISGTGSANLTVSTSSTTAPGTYTIFVTGNSGNLNHSTAVTITVNENCLARGVCPLQ